MRLTVYAPQEKVGHPREKLTFPHAGTVDLPVCEYMRHDCKVFGIVWSLVAAL